MLGSLTNDISELNEILGLLNKVSKIKRAISDLGASHVSSYSFFIHFIAGATMLPFLVH
jgi:hypothetical protein